MAGNSDGIINGIDPPPVFQYNPPGNPVGPPRPPQRLSGESTQIFILDLDRAGLSTTGYYLICTYVAVLFVAKFLYYGINTVSSGSQDTRNTTIGVITVEGECSYTISYTYLHIYMHIN